MYVPLKVTTDYSLLQSLIKVPTLVDFLVEKKIPACAICDENLYGVMAFYKACKSQNIKPLIGFSIIINEKNIYLYAMNYEGYQNLLKLHTIKEQRAITIADLNLYKNNILVIVPFKSKELYDYLKIFRYIYIGYSNLYEKSNANLITDDIVFVSDLRTLKLEDTKYLSYLDLMRQEEVQDYASNYYHEYDFIDNDKIMEIVSLLNLEIPENQKYIPKYNPKIDSSKFLRELAFKGLEKRLNGPIDDKYKNRLLRELKVINDMGFVDYFLIVYDYVLYAKKHDILVGPGRGSAAGSLVSYAIGITDIDPIKYNLLFERFLNPARVTMPDIDIDFDATKREEVIAYVKKRYGETNVALGLTFNTLKSKLVIRDVGKILNVDSNLVDKFVKNIEANKNLKSNLENVNVKKYLINYKELKKVYEIAMHLEGLKKNTSIHAAGVVISSEQLDNIIPIHYENGNLITGFSMEYLEDLGLLKMDFLGLKNLTTIANVLKYIGSNVLKDINLEDRSVYKLFSAGKTEGIFQFETPMMKSLVANLKPSTFLHLVAGVALGRPGPKDHAKEFMRRKDGIESITYIHDDLKSILEETYGVLIYQEQIIAILGKIANYSYGEADLIRRAISKKKSDVIESERNNFIKRAMNNGYSKDIAIAIYDLIVKFASYGFNKSHSVAYALIAYQMAYLKTYYPAYFLVELLNNSGSSNNFNLYLSYIKQRGIKIVRPSINNDNLDYLISSDRLILPLKTIRNISLEISEKIIAAKKDGYVDLFDFCYKTKDFINESLLITLIKAGAMDDFNMTKKTLINNIDSALNYASLQDEEGLIEKPIMVIYPEYDLETLRKEELSSYGYYISNHPASKYSKKEYLKLEDMEKYVFKKVKCIVLVERIKIIKTKNDEDMAFLVASDETKEADFTLFPNNFKLLEGIAVNNLMEVFGEVSKRFDKYSIIINNIRKVG